MSPVPRGARAAPCRKSGSVPIVVPTPGGARPSGTPTNRFGFNPGDPMDDDYNYRHFVLKGERPHFDAFRDIHHVGTVAPSFPLEDLESGENVTMKDLWSRGVVLAEFGSLT